MRRLLALAVALLALAGCGGGDEPAPAPDREPARDSPPAVPDGGRPAGHGADDGPGARREIRVPERDRTPPLAVIRVRPSGAAAPVVRRSPMRPPRLPPVALAEPVLRASAVIRDPEGTTRVRVSVRYEATCDGERRPRTLHYPPPQIGRVGLVPGRRAPTRRVRSVRVRLPTGCSVTGEAFADATNALGLESASEPVRFTYG